MLNDEQYKKKQLKIVTKNERKMNSRKKGMSFDRKKQEKIKVRELSLENDLRET